MALRLQQKSDLSGRPVVTDVRIGQRLWAVHVGKETMCLARYCAVFEVRKEPEAVMLFGPFVGSRRHASRPQA